MRAQLEEYSKFEKLITLKARASFEACCGGQLFDISQCSRDASLNESGGASQTLYDKIGFIAELISRQHAARDFDDESRKVICVLPSERRSESLRSGFIADRTD